MTKTLVDFVRDEVRRIWLQGQLYGSEFTFADVDEIAKANAHRFPAHANLASQQAVLRRMLQDERRKSKLVFAGRGVYRYDTSEKPWRTTVSKYEVQPRKAKSIRKIFKVGADIPVRYARHGRQMDIKPEDYVGAKIGDGGLNDPYAHEGCLGKHCLLRHGHPSVVLYKETAVYEETAKGNPVITIYATDRKPQQFDKGQPTPGVFVLRAIPTSWLPEARREYSVKRAKRIAKGTFKARKYKTSGKFKSPDTALRLAHF